MSSARRIRSSRENGQKSEGPCTRPGKAVSRLNSLRNGLLSSGEIIPRAYWEELLRTRARYNAHWQPQTLRQRRLIARIAFQDWKARCWSEVIEAVRREAAA